MTISRFSIGSRLAIVTVALVVSAGCTVVWSDPGRPAPTPPAAGGLGGDRAPSTAETNQVVRRALADVERYWTATYPALSHGRAFRPVRGGYHPYTRSDPPPACGSETGGYQPNAFYCPAGDFIAWDAETLMPQLYADFGALLVGVVVAHEYGHAVQSRLGRSSSPTVVLEQQADCFAGGWVADVAAGHSDTVDAADPAELDNTVAGMLMLRDQPGTSALAPQAHGNAFDRVRAFQEGFEQSATRCAAYRSDNLPVTEVRFSSPREAASGGDMPYAEAVAALSDDAQAYWQRTFPQLTGRDWQPVRLIPFDPADPPACPGRQPSSGGVSAAAYFCPEKSFVAFDNQQLGPALYQRIGDNAVGMLLGDLYAQAAQQRRGRSTQDRVGQLAVDCLAGSWTNDLLRRGDTASIRLSPGDLDEAVAALLAFGRSAPSGGGSAFERIAAYRNGVLEGLRVCD
jgi:predicted metalloprotease